MVFHFLKSQKGKNLLVEDGYLFILDKVHNDKSYWKCTQVKLGKCRARRITAGGEIKTSTFEHNHVPDAAAIDAKDTINAMKEVAKTTQHTPHVIVAEALGHLSNAVQGSLPDINGLKRTIRRQRQVHQRYPANPNSVIELRIPQEVAMTTVNNREEAFLLFDSGAVPERMLIFSTRQNLELLNRSDHWYVDGTFSCVPALFHQLYTIHGVKFNNVIPSIFVLLPNKTEATYRRMLQEVKNLQPGLHPTTVMMDFEQAAMNAFRAEFPNISLRGCLFHMSQCLWRKVQASGKAARYSNDPEFSLQVRMLTSLAFVPIPDLLAVYEQLMDSDYYMQELNDLQEILDYFEDTWIGRLQRGGERRHPIFTHDLWNCYITVLENMPRTNNSVEGWHRRFNELVAAKHPNIWKLIDCLKKEQQVKQATIEQYVQGREVLVLKKVYRDVTTRLQNCVTRYGETTSLEYLRGIAHNLNLNV